MAAKQVKLHPAAAAERERCLKIIDKIKIDLAGWLECYDRAQFAAYNIGRFQEACHDAISKGLRPRK